MLRKWILLLGSMIFISIAAVIIIKCAKPVTEAGINTKDHQLKVVTTFYPVYLIGINIADQIDNIDVKSLTELNTGCLHDYQLTTKDMKIISEADVLVVNGGGIESFLQDIKENYPDLTIIDASNGITMLKNEAGGVNPHIWLDPELYIRQIENVRDSLLQYINNSGSESGDLELKLKQNTQSYIDQISELDTWLKEINDKLTAEGGQTLSNQAVIFHDSFAYLANRVGLKVAFTVPLDSDTALSAGDIASIIDEVNKGNIRYLFTEKQYSDFIAKQIQSETAAKVYIIDSSVTGDGAKDSYLNAMRSNIKILKEALLGEK